MKAEERYGLILSYGNGESLAGSLLVYTVCSRKYLNGMVRAMATSTLISDVIEIAESVATISADLRMEILDLEESGDSYSSRIDRQRKAKLASLRSALMLEHLAKRLRECASL